MTKTTYSIRRRALLISILVSLLVFIAMFMAAYRISYHETEEILDQRLQSMAEWIAENAPNPQQSHSCSVSQYLIARDQRQSLVDDLSHPCHC